MDIRHILVATDLSDAARRSLGPAAALARGFDVPVTALHVDFVPESVRGFIDRFANDLDALYEGREDALESARQELERLGARAEGVLERGRPWKVITERAASAEGTLVVTMKHAGQRIERFFVGSTTRRLLRQGIPVLVIPVDGTASDHERFTRMLFPSDLGQTSEAMMEEAADLARKLDADLSAAHVMPWPLGGGAAPEGEDERFQQWRAMVQRELEDKLVGFGFDDPRVTVRLGAHAAEQLAAIATEQGADLICVPATGKGAVGRLVLGSTTERLVEVSPVPVLVMPQTLE